MKKTKKRIISISAIIAASVVAASSLAVLFYNVDAPTPLSTFITKFDESSVKGAKEKNQIIDGAIQKTRKLLDKYEKDTGKKADLNLQYINLKQIQPTGEKNYWYSLDRSMKAIDQRLGFTNIQRTPQTVHQAFYTQDTDMMSFYWSPDYNNVGTWVNYMLTDQYTNPNMWPLIFREINKDPSDATRQPWAESLKKKLEPFALTSSDPSHPDLKILSSHQEAIDWLSSPANKEHKYSMDSFYQLIANVVGAWMSEHSEMWIEELDIPNPINGTVSKAPQYVIDPNDQNKSAALGVQLMNFMASQNPNIPFQEEGAGTRKPVLYSNGLHMPVNPNSDPIFRDYYIYKDTFKQDVVREWYSADPFQGSPTPYNPTFSTASNTLFMQSAWSSLTSWTTVGAVDDHNFKPAGQSEGVMSSYLVGDGTSIDIQDDAVMNGLRNEYDNQKKLTLNIRPIPWVDVEGKQVVVGGRPQFLSPRDFWAGFKSFHTSVKSGVNAVNSYFIDLLGLDFDATLNDPQNKLANESSQDNKPFVLHFTDHKILSLEYALDLLQKQYYMAIPYAHEKVQNIIDDDKFAKIAKPSATNLSISDTDLTQFYGCGTGYEKSVWGDLWFAAPYYLKSVDRQKFVYEINDKYFEAFSNSELSKDYYQSYNLEKDVNGKRISKIKTLELKYAGSYNLDILYEQFKTGEINKAPVEGANIAKATQELKDYLRYISVQKVTKGNVAGFNLNIFEKWSEKDTPDGYGAAENIIMDTEGKPIWDEKTRKVLYHEDQYGNIVFPEGREPKLKPHISDTYYRLIAQDFYTPKEKDGISSTIRFAIMNSINWVSLATLVTPGVTNSVQYSFIPYGCYPITNKNNGVKLDGEYWDYAANKRYMTEEQKASMSKENIKLRLSGNTIWTYDELLSAMTKN